MGMGIRVIPRQPRILHGNGDRPHGNTAGMGIGLMVTLWGWDGHGNSAGMGTHVAVVPQ